MSIKGIDQHLAADAFSAHDPGSLHSHRSLCFHEHFHFATKWVIMII